MVWWDSTAMARRGWHQVLKEFPFPSSGCQQADAVTEVHDPFSAPDRPILVGQRGICPRERLVT